MCRRMQIFHINMSVPCINQAEPRRNNKLTRTCTRDLISPPPRRWYLRWSKIIHFRENEALRQHLKGTLLLRDLLLPKHYLGESKRWSLRFVCVYMCIFQSFVVAALERKYYIVLRENWWKVRKTARVSCLVKTKCSHI